MSPASRTYMPIMSALRRLRQEEAHSKFKASLGYIMDLRPGWVTGKFLSQKKIKWWGVI